jgi:hypothetical protein
VGCRIEKLRMAWASQRLMRRSRCADTSLAKWPVVAPMKAMRSDMPMGSSRRCQGRGTGRRSDSRAS